MTKLVRIAPIPHLPLIFNQEYQFAMMHLLGVASYRYFYQRESDYERFVILDSSRYEGHSFNIHEIVEKAEVVGASEIVVPDITNERELTRKRVKNTFAFMLSNPATRDIVEGLRPSFMLVPQGTSAADWTRSLIDLFSLHEHYRRRYPAVFSKPPSIGVASRIFLSADVDAVVRALRSVNPRKTFLLGCDGKTMSFLREYPFTAVITRKPFTTAMYPPATPMSDRHHPDNFFTRKLSYLDLNRAVAFSSDLEYAIKRSEGKRV